MTRLDSEWIRITTVLLDGALARRAGVLSASHGLRAGDAIHLASAEAVAGEDISSARFVCWDRRLGAAARELGFDVVPNS